MLLEVNPDLEQSLAARQKLDSKNIFGTFEKFVVGEDSISATKQGTKAGLATRTLTNGGASSSDEEEKNKQELEKSEIKRSKTM